MFMRRVFSYFLFSRHQQPSPPSASPSPPRPPLLPRFSLPSPRSEKKRMNARDASNLEGVGDLTAAGVRLGNRTFNSLKRDIRKKKEKGISAGGRVEGATRSTQEGVMVS